MNNKYFKPIDYKEVSKKIAYQGKRIREFMNQEIGKINQSPQEHRLKNYSQVIKFHLFPR